MRGTLPPFSLASLRPIAIACLRLVTFRPELLLSVPFLRRRIADATRAANRRDGTRFATPEYEATIELTCQFQLTPWCTMQPDAQWIIHPGGSREIDNALVIGFRTQLMF